MKHIQLSVLSLFLFITCALAQTGVCPVNIDFEQGNFTNWQCFTGSVSAAGGVNTINLNPSAPTAGRHEIMDATLNATDPYGHFPTACPSGGRYSVKLGNDHGGSEAEGISYTFQIPAFDNTFSLTYYYAVVFEDPGHNSYEQPRVYVSAYDVVTGASINCASYSYVSNGSIPGFQSSDVDPQILYKAWTPASIDFSGLAGRTVRIEFKTADCTLGLHFGYGYLDVGANCGGVLAVGTYCASANNVTLNAPFGFESYTWYNSNYTQVVGNTRTVIMSPPPPLSTIFHVDMIPYAGFGCRDTADVTVTALAVPDTPVAPPVHYCHHEVAQPLQAVAAAGNDLLWYTTPTGGTPTQTAPTPSTANLGSVDYWVSQKNPFGCEGPRSRITVTVTPIPVALFSANTTRQCITGNAFTFNSNAAGIGPGTVCSWDFGDGQTSSNCTPTHTYTSPGTYTVTLTLDNPAACSNHNQVSHMVEVVAKPVAVFNMTQPVCEHQTPIVLQNSSYLPGGLSNINGYWWQIGTIISTDTNPPSFLLNGGDYQVQLVAYAPEGCISDTATQTLHVHLSPIATFDYGPLFCSNEVLRIRDHSIMPANSTGDYVANWYWGFDNMTTASVQNPSEQFGEGSHHISLIAETNQGCKSLKADSAFIIYFNQAKAEKDTVAAMNEPMQLVTGNAYNIVSYLWSPANGLSDVYINDPIAIYEKDQLYNLKTVDIHGCKSYSKVTVRRYKGPELYVPGAFTPNDDGTNDMLKVFPVGIKAFGSFAIYNRYGQLVFSTTDYNLGWDGTFKGKKANAATYIWISSGVDYTGKAISRQGTVILYR